MEEDVGRHDEVLVIGVIRSEPYALAGDTLCLLEHAAHVIVKEFSHATPSLVLFYDDVSSTGMHNISC